MASLRGIAVVLATMAAMILPAAAQQVGTATAANPTTDRTPPGGSTVTLVVGSHIVHKERIHTSPSGSAQLLFLDKSTLSIAPNTNLLIDDFVYNPSSGTGHSLTRLTEGALRYVGGALSHEGEATVTTSAANIGIRGGTVTIIVGPHGTRVINHFGTVTIQNGAGTWWLLRQDFALTILNWNTVATEPERATAAEIAYYVALLTSKPGQFGGVPGLKTVIIGECGIGTVLGDSCPDIPWVPTENGESDAFQLIIQATQHGTGRGSSSSQQSSSSSGSGDR
jgi:hypothetical protein